MHGHRLQAASPVAVDDELALRAISDAAVAAGTSNLDVLVDVNVGMNRCGIQ